MVLIKYTVLLTFALSLITIIVAQQIKDNYIITNENCFLDGCGGLILPFTSSKLPAKSLTIWCNISEGYKDSIRNWYKDDILVTDILQNYEISFKDNLNRSSSLVIRDSSPSDVGTYKCDTIGGRSATIKVRLRPLLEQYHEYSKNNYRSANIVEGDKFSLECRVRDEFTTDVNLTWYKFDDKLLSDSYINSTDSNLIPIIGDDHIKIEGNNTIKTLTIDKIQPSDRAYYICRAFNGVTVANNTILLRVKDKLGALWPFLGIVAEVIILCTIIFIYEKRRIKPDFDESEDDHNTEAKTTPQDRVDKSDVRQRK
jgi:hypothetical protein